MKIIVTGCCGYIGAALVPHLLSADHDVTGYDPQWFGTGYLPIGNNHFRMFKSIPDEFQQADALIHLAGMTSDAACQKSPELAQAVNIDGFEPVVRKAKAAGIKRFLFLSSSAAYGSTNYPAKETDELKPTTLYAIAKARCEEVLWKHASRKFTCTALRPGGVCGYSPRMRFDLTVNRMMRDAMGRGSITVFGGAQLRPNLHMRDLIGIIKRVLEASPAAINGQAFNAGCGNLSVMDVAAKVKGATGASIVTREYTDDRSYQIDSAKIRKRLRYKFTHDVDDAIRDLSTKFRSGYWKDGLTNPIYSNIYAPAAAENRPL